MIALGVGMAAMAVLTAGMLLDYYSDRDHIERVRDASYDIRTDRIREDISAGYEGAGIRVENTWGGQTRVTGLVTLCDDGTILRAPLNRTVPAGGRILMDNLPYAGTCP